MFVTFLSDYGPGDEYVGVVEGVIASIRLPRPAAGTPVEVTYTLRFQTYGR